MSVEVPTSPHNLISVENLPNAPTPSQEGLGYSRHYAQRIRDMGNSSKESWIKRIWNHMFVNKKRDDDDDDPNKSTTIVAFTTSTHRSDKLLSSRGNKDTSSNAGSNTSNKLKDPLHTKSAPPPRLSERSKTLPSELANSPYLTSGDKNKYTILPPTKHKHHDHHDSSRKGKPQSVPSRGAHAVLPPAVPQRASVYGHPTGPVMRRPTHPYLSTHNDSWKPRVTRGYSIIQLEKRAKQIAERSIKANKVFMCDGPYPMDVYVRMAMRKRGWAEKFGPRINCMNMTHSTSAKLDVSTNHEEDFEAICDQDIPSPWAEENGLYAVVSRIVRHVPSRFIWGGRNAVNNLVTKNDVTVNHFPKARYFSSKVGLTHSLRDLPWLSSAEPLAFFPRCYILGEEEKEELVDDFRLTACVGLLKCVVHKCANKTLPSDSNANGPSASSQADDIHEGQGGREGMERNSENSQPAVFIRSHTVVNIDATKTENSKPLDSSTETTQNNDSVTSAEDNKDQQVPPGEEAGQPPVENQPITSRPDGDLEPLNPEAEGLGDDGFAREYESIISDSDRDDGEEINVEPARCRETETGDQVEVKQGKQTVTKDVDEKAATKMYFKPNRVQPIFSKQKRTGGEVPITAVEWATRELQRYINFKHHNDLDKKADHPKLNNIEWSQFLKWYHQVAHQDGGVQITESLYREAKDVLHEISKLWPQYDIDGTRDIWIVKPADKSKGIGIDFCYKLEDLLKYCNNSTTAGTYVVQKYIESPLLVHNCKFDIRQWFLVTDWNPLTIWFYKTSYLRICSQEYSYDNMHESIHLSNVAIQQNYMNGEARSNKLPDNNYMTSDSFQHYLSDIGAGHAWDEIIYPGMKHALIQTMLATQDVTEYRKGAFELYGADFMMSDDYRPWLLEINASPGMAPTSLDKAMLCANVIEDTIKVVLDRKENKHCDTGKYELVCKSAALPEFRCVDNKFITEGQKIKRADLQKYSQIDKKQQRLEVQALKREKERADREEEKKRKAEEKVEEQAKVGGAVEDNSTGENKDNAENVISEPESQQHEGKSDTVKKSGNNTPPPPAAKTLKKSDSKNKLNDASEKSGKSKVDKLKDSPYKKPLRENSKQNTGKSNATKR